MGVYRVAEVCPNGHVSTTSADTSPELREQFCSKCGEPTMTACAKCKAAIRGQFDVESVISIGDRYDPPAFCYNCGAVFPWTERKVAGAIELLEAGTNLPAQEVQQFRDDLTELTKDSPRVQAASERFKKVLSKVTPSIASGVREIIVDVLSEAAKKAIFRS